ncbi:MAG: hypothetical protein Q9217_000679 [Psora testacea]
MLGPGIEGRGLFQPEELDIDDLDYVDTYDRHAVKGNGSRFCKGKRSRRWLRPRYLCFGLAAVVAMLIAGVALNKGTGFKISKLHANQNPSAEAESPPKVEPSPEAESSAAISSPERPTPPRPPKEPPPPAEDIGPEKSNKPGRLGNVSETSESLSNKHSGFNSTSGEWTKPTDFRIIGLIFFGRPASVAILNCYLEKNMVANGGWLDEVHFVVNTDKKDDIKWLNQLVKTRKYYRKVDLGETEKGSNGYNAVWATVERDNMYIKIDDDIIFFDDEAIPNLVYTKLKHPHSLNVVANLINSPETGWLHYRFGAIHAYLPELTRPKDTLIDFESYGPRAWRASALPEWSGEDMSFPVAGVGSPGKTDDGKPLPSDVPGAPPYKGHRWLPLPDGDKNLWRTPMAETRYEQNGPDWGSWSLGAQAHYSFLQNLENHELERYHYGNGLDPKREGIWNMAYERMNINFMAIWGKDVLDNLPFESFDDELALSVQVPIKLRRRKCST